MEAEIRAASAEKTKLQWKVGIAGALAKAMSGPQRAEALPALQARGASGSAEGAAAPQPPADPGAVLKKLVSLVSIRQPERFFMLD